MHLSHSNTARNHSQLPIDVHYSFDRDQFEAFGLDDESGDWCLIGTSTISASHCRLVSWRSPCLKTLHVMKP